MWKISMFCVTVSRLQTPCNNCAIQLVASYRETNILYKPTNIAKDVASSSFTVFDMCQLPVVNQREGYIWMK